MTRIAAVGGMVAAVVGVAGYFGASAGVPGPQGRYVSHPLGVVTGSSTTGTRTGGFILCGSAPTSAAKTPALFTQDEVVRAFARQGLHLHPVHLQRKFNPDFQTFIFVAAILRLNRSGFEQANVEGPPLVAWVWTTIDLASCDQRTATALWVALRAGNVVVTVFRPPMGPPKGLVRRAKAVLADLRSVVRSPNR